MYTPTHDPLFSRSWNKGERRKFQRKMQEKLRRKISVDKRAVA